MRVSVGGWGAVFIVKQKVVKRNRWEGKGGGREAVRGKEMARGEQERRDRKMPQTRFEHDLTGLWVKC